MTNIDRWFYGHHRNAHRMVAEARNRELAAQRIGSTVTVSREVLLKAIGYRGVDTDAAKLVIERILADGETQAIARTLGIGDATLSQDA